MKFIPILISLALLAFIACSKDAMSIENPNPVQGSLTESQPSVLREMLNMPFATDYLISAVPETAPPHTRLSQEEFRFIQMGNKLDAEVLRTQYPEVKAKLIAWFSVNENDRYTMALQQIALRYLRNLFLLEPGRTAEQETEFLLGLLMATDPVDLDVLVDAFLRVKDRLDRDTRSTYLSYLRQLHDRDVSYVRSKHLEYEAAYEAATGPEKGRWLMNGKHLERLSLACQYAREQLGFPIPRDSR